MNLDKIDNTFALYSGRKINLLNILFLLKKVDYDCLKEKFNKK